MRRLATLVVAALTVAGCGVTPPDDAGATSDPTSTTAVPPSTTTPAPISSDPIRCDEAPLVSADPSLYRDDPKYVGNEMPVDAVRTWAGQYPEFVDVWIDREHNGWVTAAFTDHVEERQAEIAIEFPEDGVVAVEVQWTSEDLSDLQNRAHSELGDLVQGSWTDPLRGYVGLHIDVLSEENLAVISETFPGERICVEGLDPEDVVAPGPQPLEGDGWRLLVDEKGAGAPYSTGIAWDESSLLALTDDIDGLPTIDFDVDFETEVVVYFGAVYSGSCPNIRLDDVVIDDDTVHPLIVNTDNAFVCTADANPHAYLMALDRQVLPAAPFYVQIYPDLDNDRLYVEADLREPGATAQSGEVGPDPNPPGPQPDRSGTIIETGFPWQYEIDLVCGMEWLGEVNSYDWVASTDLPLSWLDATEGVESVVVEIVLNEGDPPFVEVFFEGESVIYTAGEPPTC